MDAQVFAPSTQLTFDTVESDRKRLFTYLQSRDVRDLYLDMSGVKRCDSAGLALLIEAKRLCMRLKKPFNIVGMPDAIHDLATFCGVDVILLGIEQ